VGQAKRKRVKWRGETGGGKGSSVCRWVGSFAPLRELKVHRQGKEVDGSQGELRQTRSWSEAALP
jgi:hypothetical protein